MLIDGSVFMMMYERMRACPRHVTGPRAFAAVSHGHLFIYLFKYVKYLADISTNHTVVWSVWTEPALS